jgi:AcrR family transcriptional regulator
MRMAKTFNEQKHQEQAKRILRKAQALFAQKGYSDTSMADIAEACEVQKATLYHYFENKEALLFGILDCHVKDEHTQERFCTLFSGKTLEERLYQVAKHHLEDMNTKESFEFLKILLVETTTSGRMKEYYQKFIHKRTDEFVEWVIEPVCKGRLSRKEMSRLAFQFFASLMHYSWQTRMVGPVEDLVGPEEDYIRELARIFGQSLES